ncbi:MAG: hypothetical protein GX552_07810, partial [Chloroflexi bacterium]|nr:hypothetical protein [Chloroflexota bacterium]
WPLWYGLRRWLVRTGLWGLAMASVSLIVPPLLTWLFPALNVGASPQTHISMVLLATTMAILPGTWSDMLAAHDRDSMSSGVLQSSTMRELARGVVGLVVVLTLLGALRIAAPLWQHWNGATHAVTVQEWFGAQWNRLETGIDTLLGQYYLRRYDRRAPVRAKATPTAAPPAQEEHAP